MSKRDFFRLLIKVFGLYWFISTTFVFVPTSMGYLLSSDIESISLLIISLAIVAFVFYACMAKADHVIDWFRLDQGFDEEKIEMINFNPSVIIKLALFIIGAVLIVNSFPDFLMHALYALQEDIAGISLRPESNFHWAISGIKLIIGVLLIKNHNWIEHSLMKSKNNANSNL